MRNILTLTILAWALSPVSGQSQTTFGLGAGMNLATMKYDGPQNFLPLSTHSYDGFTGYAFLNKVLYKQFSIQTEIGYYGFGGISKNDIQGPGDGLVGQVNITTRLNYIVLSLMPKFTIPKTGLSIFAGPSLGWLVSSHSGYQVETLHPEEIGGFFSPNYSTVSGFAVGGAEFSSPSGLGFSARYMYGYNNILPLGLYTNTRISSFNFSVIYKLQTSRK